MSSEAAIFPTDLLWFMDGDVSVEEGNRGGQGDHSRRREK